MTNLHGIQVAAAAGDNVTLTACNPFTLDTVTLTGQVVDRRNTYLTLAVASRWQPVVVMLDSIVAFQALAVAA